MKILIAGGGIGGLTAALALLQKGHEVAVFERAKAPLKGGAGVTLWSDATRVLYALGLAETLAENSSLLDTGRVLSHQGQELARVRLGKLARKEGFPVVGISRAKLAALLLQALPASVVHFGQSASSFEEYPDKVQLNFSDGSSAQGDVLVGADGIRSRVRHQLLGDEPRYSGYLGCQGLTDNPLTPRISHWYHGIGGQFGLVPLANSESYWFATTKGPPEATMEQLLPKFQTWSEPIPKLLRNFDPDRAVVTPIYDSYFSRVWGRGRVTLLGDAAQATTPTFGHGACLAINAGWSLAHHLSLGKAPSEALRAYERERRGPAQEIALGSRLVGELLHLDSPLLCQARNLSFRSTPNLLHEWSAAWIVKRAAGRFDILS